LVFGTKEIEVAFWFFTDAISISVIIVVGLNLQPYASLLSIGHPINYSGKAPLSYQDYAPRLCSPWSVIPSILSRSSSLFFFTQIWAPIVPSSPKLVGSPRHHRSALLGHNCCRSSDIFTLNLDFPCLLDCYISLASLEPINDTLYRDLNKTHLIFLSMFKHITKDLVSFSFIPLVWHSWLTDTIFVLAILFDIHLWHESRICTKTWEMQSIDLKRENFGVTSLLYQLKPKPHLDWKYKCANHLLQWFCTVSRDT